MKQFILACILFLISGICNGQEVKIPVKSTGETAGTAMQELPSQGFLVFDTFEDKVEKGKLPPGWEIWIGFPPSVSTFPGKDGEGLGLSIDDSKGEICLSRSFKPQTGIFTVEMDLSPLTLSREGAGYFYLGGEDFWIWEARKFVCMRYSQEGDSAVQFSCYGDDRKQTKKTMGKSRWYHFRYIIDVPHQCFDLFIEGDTVVSKSTFQSPSSGLSRLVIRMSDKGNKKGRDELLLDNLKIYPGTTVPPEGSPVAPGMIPQQKESTASAGSKVESLNKSGYRLTFHDEFDGAKLNTNYWNVGRKPTDAISDEILVKELYPYEIKDGVLKLIVKKRKTNQENEKFLSDYVAQMPRNMNDALKIYTAPAVATWHKFDQTYGWFEVRCKMPRAFGLWYDFWVYSYRPKTGGAEIDVCEAPSRLHDKVTCALHRHLEGWEYETVYTNHGIPVPGKTDDFHVYAVDWEPEKLTYYVDGKQVGEYTGKGVPFTPEYIILSCRTGGWGGLYVDESALPDAFEIDYVRVYQKE